MNRSVLLGLLLLTALAAGGIVLLGGGGDGQEQPPLQVDDGQAPDDPTSGSNEAAEAEVESSGDRTAVTDTGNPQSDPDAVTGRIIGPDGRGLERGRVVFGHRQFGGEELGWNLQSILLVGTGAESDGRFRLPIEPGRRSELVVVAAVPGYVPTRVTGVAAGDFVTIQLPEQWNIPGVVYAPNGSPAQGVPVQLYDPLSRKDGLPANAVTDAEGRFTIGAPGEGEFRLRVSSAAGSDYDERLHLQARDQEIEVRLAGSLALQATVRDESGQAIAGAQLTLSLGRSHKERVLESNELGEIGVFGLSPGKWSGILSAESYSPIPVAFEFLDSTIFEEWTLAPFATLAVNAKNAKGRALPNATIRLIPDPRLNLPKEAFQQVLTNEEGVAMFEQVLPGRYVIAPEAFPGANPTELFELSAEDAQTRGADRGAKLIEIRSGENQRVDLELRRHGYLTLLLRRNGDPVVGARGVMTVGIGPRMREVEAGDLSDLKGRLVFPAVWMGTYTVTLQGSPSEPPIVREFEVGRGSGKETVELPAGVIRGRLRSPQGVVDNAKIFVGTQAGKLRPLGGVDSNGRFEFVGFEAGTYQVRIEAPGMLPWENFYFAHDGSELDLGAVDLSEAFTLKGTVPGLRGTDSLFGPMVSVYDSEGRSVASQAIAADGSFQVPGIAGGVYMLKVYDGGREAGTQRVEIPRDRDGIEIKIR